MEKRWIIKTDDGYVLDCFGPDPEYTDTQELATSFAHKSAAEHYAERLPEGQKYTLEQVSA